MKGTIKKVQIVRKRTYRLRSWYHSWSFVASHSRDRNLQRKTNYLWLWWFYRWLCNWRRFSEWFGYQIIIRSVVKWIIGFAYYLHLNPINNKCVRIELSPTKISLFQVNKVQQGESNYQWLYLTMKQLCSQMGTELTILENGNFGVNMLEAV